MYVQSTKTTTCHLDIWHCQAFFAGKVILFFCQYKYYNNDNRSLVLSLQMYKCQNCRVKLRITASFITTAFKIFSHPTTYFLYTHRLLKCRLSPMKISHLRSSSYKYYNNDIGSLIFSLQMYKCQNCKVKLRITDLRGNVLHYCF